MAKLKHNDFIKKHKTGIGVTLVFRDYYNALQRRSRAKGRVPSGRFRLSDGQELPTPNETVSELLKKAKGDYVLKSERTVAQHVIFSDPQDAIAAIKLSNAQKAVSAQKPVSQQHNGVISEVQHIKLAQNLGLLDAIQAPAKKTP